MKKLAITLFTIILASVFTYAQAPHAFKYQAVARDASGEILANAFISLKVSILKESPDGKVVYSEIHQAQTTTLGLINLSIGKGKAPTTQFDLIDWGAGNHYMQFEMDPSGGNDFIYMGTAELLSVPYALYALSSGSENGGPSDADKEWILDKITGIMYNGNSGNVGIGTPTPTTILDVNGTVTANGGNSDEWNTAYGWGNHALVGYLTEEIDGDPTNEIEIPTGGTNGQVLQTDGNGTLNWSDDAGASEINDLVDGKTDATSVFLGSGAGFNDAGENKNVAVGYDAMKLNNSGSYNTANGYQALLSNTEGGLNSANGYKALFSNTTGSSNLANGGEALFSNTEGNMNTANGVATLRSNTKGNNNTANGYKALFSNTTGSSNTAYGFNALVSNTTGCYNMANGVWALGGNKTGWYNIATGNWALYFNTTGRYNIANGHNTLHHNTSGLYNIGIGTSANYYNQEGSYNTIIGYEAGKGESVHDKSGNVFLGYKAGYHETTNNKLYIENSNATTPLIYGEFDNDLLRVNGTLDVNNAYQFPTSDGANGQVLQTDGSGALSWTDNGGEVDHYIGELIGANGEDGVVFWVDHTGEHGLICSKEDLNGGAGTPWYISIGSYPLIGATSDWDGANNTISIINSQGAGTYAASICASYTTIGTSPGDWYLPAIDEIIKMYHQKYEIDKALNNNSFSRTVYLSSTELSNITVYIFNFYSGILEGSHKYNCQGVVKAVRAF